MTQDIEGKDDIEGICREREIMHARFVFDGAETKFVRGAVNSAALNAPARHPHAEAVVIVVAAEF